MSIDAALRATEILLGLALLQQSAEQLTGPHRLRWVYALRAGLSALLIVGAAPVLSTTLLAAVALGLLHVYQGPYNGGSDRMGTLVLFVLTGAHLVPNLFWQEALLTYLAVQAVLSYFVSGRVKIANPAWRSGEALRDVFAFSAYPVSEGLRGLAARPRVLWAASWAVILFELMFPLALISPITLSIAVGCAVCFHFANACLFGLNRFFWVWPASYPALFWMQDGLF